MTVDEIFEKIKNKEKVIFVNKLELKRTFIPTGIIKVNNTENVYRVYDENGDDYSLFSIEEYKTETKNITIKICNINLDYDNENDFEFLFERFLDDNGYSFEDYEVFFS